MNETGRILLVDDDTGVRVSLKMWLAGEGLTVLVAANGAEALAAMRDQAPQACLVDLRIRDENGIELARRLQQIDDTVPIVILTAYPAYETATAAIKTGVFDYVAKSLESSALLDKVRTALSEHHRRRRLRDEQIRDKHNLVLVCAHAPVRIALEGFCLENPGFHLQHVFASMEALHQGDYLPASQLLLICEKCFLLQPERVEENLALCRLSFPNARIMAINSRMPEFQMDEFVRRGVKGFIADDATGSVLGKAFHCVLAGEMWISRSLSQRLLAELLEDTVVSVPGGKTAGDYDLTGREMEVLAAMVAGLSNGDIGQRLFISEKTVKTHINNIFRKMMVKSRTQAVVKALETRLVEGRAVGGSGEGV